MPPKLYVTEVDPADMDDDEKRINRELAARLFANVMQGKPGATLDVGARLPVLAQALGALTGQMAIALDPNIIPLDGVEHRSYDFEERDFSESQARFSLITMIHVFEHMYDPLAALRKLRRLVADDGRVFLRLPQHDVTGYERDMNEDRYKIHPFFHSMQSMLECLHQVKDLFVVESVNRMDGWGQADFTLRPI